MRFKEMHLARSWQRPSLPRYALGNRFIVIVNYGMTTVPELKVRMAAFEVFLRAQLLASAIIGRSHHRPTSLKPDAVVRSNAAKHCFDLAMRFQDADSAMLRAAQCGRRRRARQAAQPLRHGDEADVSSVASTSVACANRGGIATGSRTDSGADAFALRCYSTCLSVTTRIAALLLKARSPWHTVRPPTSMPS